MQAVMVWLWCMRRQLTDVWIEFQRRHWLRPCTEPCQARLEIAAQGLALVRHANLPQPSRKLREAARLSRRFPLLTMMGTDSPPTAALN
jgi:hypothetical protein